VDVLFSHFNLRFLVLFVDVAAYFPSLYLLFFPLPWSFVYGSLGMQNCGCWWVGLSFDLVLLGLLLFSAWRLGV